MQNGHDCGTGDRMLRREAVLRSAAHQRLLTHILHGLSVPDIGPDIPELRGLCHGGGQAGQKQAKGQKQAQRAADRFHITFLLCI